MFFQALPPINHVRSQRETDPDPAAVAMGFGINLGAGCWRLQAGDVLRLGKWLTTIHGRFGSSYFSMVKNPQHPRVKNSLGVFGLAGLARMFAVVPNVPT